MKRHLAVIAFCVFCVVLVQAQEQKPQPTPPAHDTSNMDMQGHDMGKMGAPDAAPDSDSAANAMHTMEGHHMDMGPHMKMTAVREMKPGDQEKADQVVQAAKKAATQYQDYKVALADGYQIFLPNIPQKQYHFTNYRYGFEAAMRFNPEHPTSLLYEKQGDSYKLIGVMYTARKTSTEEDLDQRIPLSVAQWHAHINMCIPPKERRQEMFQHKPQFGLHGSITTQEACDAAGGRFMPQIFGWMVHVYPFEQKPEDVWSVERQHNHMD